MNGLIIPAVGFSRFTSVLRYRFSKFINLTNRLAFAVSTVLVPLRETEPAEKITFEMKPADKELKSNHCILLYTFTDSVA